MITLNIRIVYTSSTYIIVELGVFVVNNQLHLVSRE